HHGGPLSGRRARSIHEAGECLLEGVGAHVCGVGTERGVAQGDVHREARKPAKSAEPLLPSVSDAYGREPALEFVAPEVWVAAAAGCDADVHYRGDARALQELREVILAECAVPNGQQLGHRTPPLRGRAGHVSKVTGGTAGVSAIYLG